VSEIRDMTSPAQDAGTVVRAVRRHWRAAVAVLSLTLLATFGVSRLGARHYEATAQILLQLPDQVNAVLNPDAITSAANAQREVNTNAQLITSIPVAEAVRRQLHLNESVRELIDRVTVSGEATSNLVQITAKDARPDRAAEVATAVAQQYQAYRRHSAQDAIGSAIAAADVRLRGMDEAARRSAEGQALEARLHQLETGSAVATGGVQVVRPATVPSAPVPRLTAVSAAVALALGLALAVLAVAVLERVDRRLPDEDAVEEAFGLAVIGRIPALGRAGHRDRRRVEAFDALAARLRFATPAQPGRVLMVAATGPCPGDDVAIRLAEALADLEPRVLLIDADLRHEASAAGVELVAGGGLTAILCGESTFDEEVVLATYGDAGDDLLPDRAWELLGAGPGASRPTRLLASPEMEGVLALARKRADIVIVAVASLTSGADALAVAPLCDEILVVVRERSATRDQADGVREVLSATPTPVLGIVVEHGAEARWAPTWPKHHEERTRALLSAPSAGRREVV
jgi:tyrosine-protein kinase